MALFIGELAALAAALSFSLASTSYTLAGRRFGASASMALSLVISLLCLLPLHQVMLGELFPAPVAPERWLALALSSLSGFVFSALFLLRAFQCIGPRLTLLITSTSPIFAALMDWIFLGRGLPAHTVAGIALVFAGVFAVLADKPARLASGGSAAYAKGLLLALASALTQGASFVLMSAGVADGFPVLSASLIRTVVGLVVLALLIGLRGQLRHNLDLLTSERRAISLIVLAALTGPVLGAALVLLSLQYTSVGISSTLTGTTPILMIPISVLVFGERVGPRALLGALARGGGRGRPLRLINGGPLPFA